MKTKRMTCRAYLKSVNEIDRTVEQIVSVFGNVDFGNDRVVLGAFKGSLDRWAASGDPIPTIWSHTWDDPFAHIGAVLEAKELAPGDPLLPEEISALGGLYTKYQVDPFPFADQVFHLLKTRRVREASFAYDVIKERRAADGANELIELDLIEVGPTLKGMNPMTQLLSAKAIRDALAAELGAGWAAGKSDEEIEAAVGRALAKTSMVPHTYIPGDDDRCTVCGLTRNTVAHLNLLSAGAEGAKAWVTVPGCMEERQDAVYDEVLEWAQDQYGSELYCIDLEATFDDHVVFYVELWSDPLGDGDFFQAPYTVGADPDEAEGDDDDPGPAVELGEVTQVVIEGVVVPKSRRKSLRRAAISRGDGSPSKAIKVGTVDSGTPEDPKGKAKARKSDPSAEDSEETTGPAEGVTPARALAESDLLELT